MPDSSFSSGNQMAVTEIDADSPITETLLNKYRDRDIELMDLMSLFGAPLSVGTGSAVAHEGDVTISANQNLSGLHYYDNLTINSGVTVTANEPLVIMCTGTFDMTGATLTATGQGGAGGGNSTDGQAGGFGAGGGGGGISGQAGGDGGDAMLGLFTTLGGVYGVGVAGTDAAAVSSAVIAAYLLNWMFLSEGGAGGGGGAGTDPVLGGDGGGVIIIIAPTIVCTSGTISADGADGADGTDGGAGDGGGAGGGGGGYIRLATKNYTAGTVSVAGGSGGAADGGTAYAGGDGSDGIKQIDVFG